MLCKRKGVAIDDAAFSSLEGQMPERLTPGAAETLAAPTRRSADAASQ
jgi:hypothetical protein